MSSDMSSNGWLVEIGSGSLKSLVVASGDGDGGQSANEHRSSRFLGLSTELDRSDGVSDEGLNRLDEALQDLADFGRDRNLGTPTVVGCELLRRSQPVREAATRLVQKHLNAQLLVLSAEQEATVSLHGAVAHRSMDLAQPLVVMDLGSASTELAAVEVVGDGSELGDVASFSLPLGGHTVAAGYLTSDPPDPAELSAALSVIELHLDDLRREHRVLAAAIGRGSIVGMGAFVQVAAVEIGVDISDGPDPVDRYVLEREAAEEIFRVLATESRADRIHNPGLLHDHVDGAVGALCIVVEFMRQFSIDSIEVTTADLLDGLAASRFSGNAKLGL